MKCFKGRQRGRAVRAPDLKSGGRGFKTRSDHLAGVVSAELVNRQLVCLLSFGIFKPTMFSTYICFFQCKWHACELARCS